MKKMYLVKSIALAGALLAANASNAQMVGSEIFLQGNYVELGITVHGSYGTTTSPAGYHPHPGGASTALGFVADPDMDGWGVGTPPYMGDYFYPGTPFEGWELQVDSAFHHQEFNTSTTTFGANTAYTLSGTKKSGTWEGMVDSIMVTQVTTIDTADLYFTINITLTNLATTPKNEIYYMRSLDPDNDETWPGGSFVTTNAIDHQSTDTTVVSATGGSTSHPYLGLGTTDTAATALVYSNWYPTDTTNIANMYNQTYYDAGTLYTQGSSSYADYALALIKYVPHLATVDSAADSVWRTTSTYYNRHPANSASFTFFYSFSPVATDSAIARLHQITNPITLNVKNVNSTGDVKVYPNPSKDIVRISNLGITDHISLYDMMGRVINENWTVGHEGLNTFHYGNIPVGAYMLIVTDEHGSVKSRTPVRKM